MPLPPFTTTVTVTGTYVDSLGNPRSGSVVFRPVIETSGGGVSVVPTATRKTLDANGHFSVQIPTSDNGGLDPDGQAYEVRELIDGGFYNRYIIQLPTTPSTQDISTLRPFDAVPSTSQYALKSEVDELTNRLSFYTEQATPLATWTIHHGLGYRPSTYVVDSANEQVIPHVRHIDDNNVELTFVFATAGAAYFS